MDSKKLEEVKKKMTTEEEIKSIRKRLAELNTEEIGLKTKLYYLENHKRILNGLTCGHDFEHIDPSNPEWMKTSKRCRLCGLDDNGLNTVELIKNFAHTKLETK